jgi:glutamate synthase (NADPH/NADH) small chain
MDPAQAMSETDFSSRAPQLPEIAARFADLHPPLGKTAAVAEANRCLYCFDAPCMGACPTHIDVAAFIRKIASGNTQGSAATILDANILGASCARACPVEVLCEGACVLHGVGQRPIAIGLLQRFAMETFHSSGEPLPFAPGPDTGKKVALVGGGPASLACAAELRRRGIHAEIFDARPLPGGLNTYGVAEYKLPLAESLREIDFIAQLGVVFHMSTKVDAAQLAVLERDYDAIFLGVGHDAMRALGIGGEDSLEGVTGALDFIAGYKSGVITSAPARVAVIGGGNTAIDAAVAARRLGAIEIHLVYRRGLSEMPAYSFEYEHAMTAGVRFLWQTQPVGLHGDTRVEGLELRGLAPTSHGSLLPGDGENFILHVDLVVSAIGQGTDMELLSEVNRGTAGIRVEGGRVCIDPATGQTSNPKYFAGGDCANGGREVVDAVADGKRAGIGIVAWFEAQQGRLDAHA